MIGSWDIRNYPNIVKATVWVFGKTTFFHNSNTDIMISDHFFCKASSAMSHFSCLEIYLHFCFELCNISFRLDLYLSFAVKVLKWPLAKVNQLYLDLGQNF